MLLLGQLADVEVAAAGADHRLDDGALVGVVAGEVEVHAVDAHLGDGGGGEPQAHLGGVARQQHAAGVVDDVAAEHAGPEPRQPRGVVGVEGQGEQLGGHPGTLGAQPE